MNEPPNVMRPVTGSGGTTLDITRSRPGSSTTSLDGRALTAAQLSPANAPTVAGSVNGDSAAGHGPRSIFFAAMFPSGRTIKPLYAAPVPFGSSGRSRRASVAPVNGSSFTITLP